MSDTEHVADKWVKTIVGVALLFWLMLAFMLGASGAFVRAQGALLFPVLEGFLAPILIFLVAFWTVGPFRDFVMSTKLPVIVGVPGMEVRRTGVHCLICLRRIARAICLACRTW